MKTYFVRLTRRAAFLFVALIMACSEDISVTVDVIAYDVNSPWSRESLLADTERRTRSFVMGLSPRKRAVVADAILEFAGQQHSLIYAMLTRDSQAFTSQPFEWVNRIPSQLPAELEKRLASTLPEEQLRTLREEWNRGAKMRAQRWAQEQALEPEFLGLPHDTRASLIPILFEMRTNGDDCAIVVVTRCIHDGNNWDQAWREQLSPYRERVGALTEEALRGFDQYQDRRFLGALEGCAMMIGRLKIR